MINNYLIPVILLIIIFFGFIKRIDLYDSFVEGCLDGLKIVIKVIPALLAMILAVNIFLKSNILYYLFKNMNGDILSMIFLRPISGNASLAVLNRIFYKFGPDSFFGFLASIIQGATDTTIYVLALYFGSVGIKKVRYSLVVGLMADFFGIIAALVVAKIFF